MLLPRGAHHCRLLHVSPRCPGSLKPIQSTQARAVLLPPIDDPELPSESDDVAQSVGGLAVTESEPRDIDTVVGANDSGCLLDCPAEPPDQSAAPVLGHRLRAELQIPAPSDRPLIGDEEHGIWFHILEHIIQRRPESLEFDIVQATPCRAELDCCLEVRAGLARAGRAYCVASL